LDLTILFHFPQVVATDLDSGKNGEIAYSITATTAPGLFDIDAVTGDVTLQGSLDYETEDLYTLTLTAKDNGSPSLKSTVVLDISVLDVNEQPSISCVGSCIYTVSEGRLQCRILEEIDNSSDYIPSVSKKTGHCLISCNVKAIKAIAMKLRFIQTNLDLEEIISLASE
jgi:hypothetical protein